MKVFKLHVDCAKCYWVGVALVAAVSYEVAVSEYICQSENGEFVASGEIIFTEDSRRPIEGLTCNGTKILCDVVVFNA